MGRHPTWLGRSAGWLHGRAATKSWVEQIALGGMPLPMIMKMDE